VKSDTCVYCEDFSADDLSLSYVKLAQHLAASKGYPGACSLIISSLGKLRVLCSSGLISRTRYADFAVTVFRRSLQYLTFLCSSSYSFKLLLAFMFVCSFILLSVRHCWVLCWQIVYGSCTCCPRVCTQEVLYGGKISGASSATSACPWPSSTQVSVLIQPCATFVIELLCFLLFWNWKTLHALWIWKILLFVSTCATCGVY
jgi:hypothetical protein